VKSAGVIRTRKQGLALVRDKIADSNRMFDDTVFDSVGVREAYFLGYLCADGCVCVTTNGRYTLSVTSADKELVSRLRDHLSAHNRWRIEHTKEGRVYYRMAFCSRHLCERLVELGCGVRKSLVLDKPNIPQALWFPFLLGYFDGDGSLSRNKSINSWKVSIGTGSYRFRDWMVSVLDGLGFVYSTEERKTRKKKPFYGVTMMILQDFSLCSVGENRPLDALSSLST